MFQLCKINMEHSNQKWTFYIMAGINRKFCGKHLSKPTSTTTGHLNQQRQTTRTTKVRDPKVIITEPYLDQNIKFHFVYAATIDAGQTCNNQTGISSGVKKR
jgi:hypothetical protein